MEASRVPARTLITVLLCVLPASAALAGPVGPGPAEAPVQLDDCTVVEWVARLTSEQARPLVPSHFGFNTGPGSLVGPGGVALAFGGTVCASGPGGRPAGVGVLAIEVVPEDPALAAPGVGHYFFDLERNLEPGPLRDAFAALGASFTPVASVSLAGEGPSVALRIEGDGWAHRVAAPFAAAVPGTGSVLLNFRFREYSPAPGGYAYLDATWAPRPEGSALFMPATFVAGQGSAARAVLGAEGAGVGLYGTRADYAGAVVGRVLV